jgi:DNA-binding transcriptional LysR family regulator
MGVIGAMNFAALDLNLLRVFDAMTIELNTTRAGERVGLSQPAVSSALGRLRHIIGDELFVREGNRMVPTERAVALQEPIREALRQMEDALSAVARFDPASATQTFRISGSDYFSILLMPPLTAAVMREAPGVTLQMIDHPSADAVRLLGEGAIDLAVVPVEANKPTIVDARLEVPDWVCSRKLLESFVVSVVPNRHRVLEKAGIKPGHRIPAEVFCEIPQVLMSMDGSKIGTIDPVLAERGLKRRIALTVPHFQAVALAIAESGLLGNLPIHFARAVAPALGLALYLPPYDPPITDVMLFWHRRVDAHAANAWLRNHIAKELDFGPLELKEPLTI